MSVHGPEVVDDREGRQEPEAQQPPARERVASRSRRPLVAGGLAGMWALVVGVGLVTCLVMLAWAVSPNSAGDAAAAWRAAGLTWLGAHLVPLQVAGEPVTLLPIGGLLLGLLLARRSGAWAGRLLPDPAVGEVAWLVLGAGLLYGAGGAAVAWLSAGESASAQPGPAGLVTGVVAGVGVLWGIAGEARLRERARARVSDAAWRTCVAGLAGVVGLFAAGSLLTTASLVRHFAEVAGTLSDLDPGLLGAAAVTLVDALSLPNLAIWAVSVIVGPGFQLGSTGGLSAFGGEVESLPALPVLAAIPTSTPGWAPALLAVPVLLGVLAGRIRWGRDLPTVSGALLGALGLAAVTAPLTAGMLRLSLGSLGADRLAQVGPVLWPATLAATGLLVLGFLAEAAFQSLRLSWDLHRAERRAAARSAPDPAAIEVSGGSAEDAVEAVEDRDAADPGIDPVGAPEDATTSAGWVRGARQAVGRRVSGVGASAVSVVSGVSGAAVAAASGVVGGRGPEGAAEAARSSEEAGEPPVVDVREEEIDLRADSGRTGEGADDPSGAAGIVDPPAQAGESAPGAHDDDADGSSTAALDVADDGEGPGTTGDDTAEIPVITATEAPPQESASPGD